MPHKPMVNIAVEGLLDQEVLEKILISVGIEVENVYGKEGKDKLKENISRYNKAARFRRWVVLVDLNSDAPCPPPFIATWLPERNPDLIFRVAVRTIETWLLADREAIADYLKVPISKIPLRPEEEIKPKVTLINIARHSRSKKIRDEMVPREGSSAKQGPLYTSRMIEFTAKYWDPYRAASHTASLRRSIDSCARW